MEDLKIKALEKLNEELSKEHSKALDKIHNFISDQEDDELFESILKEGKTLEKSLQYVAGEVKKASKSSTAMVDDEDVYKMVVDYYKSIKTDVPDVAIIKAEQKKVTYDQKKVSKDNSDLVKKLELDNKNLHQQLDKIMGYKKPKQTKEIGEELSIFDFMDDGSDSDEANT